MKDKAERSTDKTNVYMGGEEGASWRKAGDTLGPDLPMNITEERPIETWNLCVTPTII